MKIIIISLVKCKQEAQLIFSDLNLKAPNTKVAFANTIDPDAKAHNEPSHLDPQCLPSIL